MTERCCRRLYGRHVSMNATCGKSAPVEEGGKWYCRIHAPSLVEKKQAAREAIRQENLVSQESAWKKHDDITKAKARIVELAREYCTRRTWTEHEKQAVGNIIQTMRTAMAVLEQLERQS